MAFCTQPNMGPCVPTTHTFPITHCSDPTEPIFITPVLQHLNTEQKKHLLRGHSQ